MKSNDIHGVVTARIRALRILATVLVGAFAILCIFPFVWMISTSFKYEIDVMEFPIHIIPTRVNTGNYSYVWTQSDFPLYYLNTIKVAIITVLGEITVTTFAAYASQVMLLPKYIYFSRLHIVNTHAALILPGLFSVFSVLLMRNTFQNIPFEFTEAAYIDGAGHPRIFGQLILPLAKPGLMTLLLLDFTWVWNDYMNPLIFISNEKLFTLTVGLQRFQEDASTSYALIMAGATISLIPILLIFIFTQKFFIESFASAGIKG